jgi:hypothetical protein
MAGGRKKTSRPLRAACTLSSNGTYTRRLLCWIFCVFGRTSSWGRGLSSQSVWIEIEQMVGSFLIMVLVLPPRVSTGSFPLTLHTNR